MPPWRPIAPAKGEKELVYWVLGGMQAARNQFDVCDSKEWLERVGDGSTKSSERSICDER